MHLSTEEPAASRMLEPFGEVGGDVPEYFASQHILLKLKIKKLLRKIRSKNLSAGVYMVMSVPWLNYPLTIEALTGGGGGGGEAEIN